MTRDIGAAVLCDDGELDYLGSRTRFVEGGALSLDESYRLAHLPLVAPAHPRVIPRRDGTPYDRGRHAPVTSLVLPVPGAALRHSPAALALEADLRQSPFAHKIAWHVMEPRQDRLHATLCSSRSNGAPPTTPGDAQRAALQQLGPLTVEVRGLFSGNVNIGRLYLRAYPEKRDGLNLFHRIQEIVGRPRTSLYVVGLYNLVDDLDVAETAALARLIERWWDVPLMRLQADVLWLLKAWDDLVLEATVVEALSLA